MENESQRSAQWDPKILKNQQKKQTGVPRGGPGYGLRKYFKKRDFRTSRNLETLIFARER